MDNLEYIIFGGGERAFDIIHKLPYGSIKYIVDNDIDKCGKIYMEFQFLILECY